MRGPDQRPWRIVIAYKELLEIRRGSSIILQRGQAPKRTEMPWLALSKLEETSPLVVPDPSDGDANDQ